MKTIVKIKKSIWRTGKYSLVSNAGEVLADGFDSPADAREHIACNPDALELYANYTLHI